jgi:hypothetical protein
MCSISSDHLIGAPEQHRRQVEAKRFGGLEVDDQLEFGLLVKGEFSRISALENLRNLACGTARKDLKIGRIGHQSAEFDVLTIRIDCRNPAFRGQFDEQPTIRELLGFVGNQNAIHSLVFHRVKDPLVLMFVKANHRFARQRNACPPACLSRRSACNSFPVVCGEDFALKVYDCPVTFGGIVNVFECPCHIEGGLDGVKTSQSLGNNHFLSSKLGAFSVCPLARAVTSFAASRRVNSFLPLSDAGA